VIQGRGGDDRLHGSSGRDALRGGAGADRLQGGTNTDGLVCNSGADTVDGPTAGEVMGRDCETLQYALGPYGEDTLRVPVNPRGRTFTMSCPVLEIRDGELSPCHGTLTLRETGGKRRVLGSGRIADAGERRAFGVRLTLTAAGRQALARERRTIATVRIAGTNVPTRAWTIRVGR